MNNIIDYIKKILNNLSTSEVDTPAWNSNGMPGIGTPIPTFKFTATESLLSSETTVATSPPTETNSPTEPPTSNTVPARSSILSELEIDANADMFTWGVPPNTP